MTGLDGMMGSMMAWMLVDWVCTRLQNEEFQLLSAGKGNTRTPAQLESSQSQQSRSRDELPRPVLGGVGRFHRRGATSVVDETFAAMILIHTSPIMGIRSPRFRRC